MRATIAASTLLLLAMSACEERSTITIGGPAEACTLTLNNLAGTQWVMYEAMPGAPARPNPRARMRFTQGDSGLKVEYSVGSPFEMHTYDCRVGPREINCMEEAKLMDWCLSLEVHQPGSCTPSRLRELGASGFEEEELAKAASDARKEIASVTEQAKKDPRLLAQYKLARNNLGNKLRGLLDVRVNEKRCQLIVTDQYMTIYNGNKIVDSNPVGTNPFVQDKDNTWLWDNCMEGTKFLALQQETAPSDQDLQAIDPRRQFSNKDTIYYHYVGLKNIEAKDGCSYSADTWAQWQPLAQGVELGTMDCDFTIPEGNDPKKGRRVRKCVNWSASHQWSDTSGLGFVAEDDSIPRAFFGMTRYQTCDGKKEKLDTICAAARIVEM
jgi:hypothetical protein